MVNSMTPMDDGAMQTQDQTLAPSIKKQPAGTAVAAPALPAAPATPASPAAPITPTAGVQTLPAMPPVAPPVTPPSVQSPVPQIGPRTGYYNDPMLGGSIPRATPAPAPPPTDITPSTSSVQPISMAAPAAPATPAHWSLSDPRTQAEILQDDFGGDYNKFIAASPNASISALASLPGFGQNDVQYGQNGSVMNSKTGATESGPDESIADIVNAPFDPKKQTTGTTLGAGGVGGVGGTGAQIPGTQTSYLQGGLQTDAQGKPVPGGYNALSDIYGQLGVTPGTVNDRVLDLVKQNPNLINGLPTDAANVLRQTLGAMGLDTNGASSANTPGAPGTAGTPSVPPAGQPSNPLDAILKPNIDPGTTGGPQFGGQIAPPSTGRDTGAPSTPGSSGTSGGVGGFGGSTGNPVLDALLHGDQTANGRAPGSVGLANTDANNALTGKTISVSGQNDPVQMALSAYNTFRQSTDPQYQADLRDATRTAAATGAIGSGSLNTSLGNIANTRQNTLATKEQDLLNGALGTQNENAYRDVGIAQQQQGFQNGQQEDAFNQSLQQYLAGNSGDPSQLGLALSAIFGQQATSAGNNLGSLISGSTANGSSNDILQQILRAMGSGGGSSSYTPDPSTQAILNGVDQYKIPGVQTTGTTGGH